MPPGEYYHVGLKKQLQNLLDKDCNGEVSNKLLLDIHTDGGRLSKKNCFWAIMVRIFNMNKQNVAVVGIYKGKSKPKSSIRFFRSFVREALLLKTEGFYYKEQRIEVRYRCFIADAPARAFGLNHASHSSETPCSKCKIVGEYKKFKNKNKVTGHMVLLGTDHEPRTAEDYCSRLDTKHHMDEPSPLLPLFDSLVCQTPFEYMHLVLLGVLMKLLFVWIQGKYNKLARLNRISKETVYERFNQISAFCPEEYARKSENLEKFDSFKATELRQILLVSGVVILKDCLPTHLYSNFLLLHAAIRSLCYYANSEKHLKFAESALEIFVNRAPDLYTE